MLVNVEVESCSGYSVPSELVEFRRWLDERISRIPETLLHTATISIESEESYGSSYANLTISYKRPETPDEASALAAREQANKTYNEARERELLERLQRKYQNG